MKYGLVKYPGAAVTKETLVKLLEKECVEITFVREHGDQEVLPLELFEILKTALLQKPIETERFVGIRKIREFFKTNLQTPEARKIFSDLNFGVLKIVLTPRMDKKLDGKNTDIVSIRVATGKDSTVTAGLFSLVF